jgi:hypothetical protein
MGGSGGGGESTILALIREHLDPSGCGLLPGGYDLPGGEGELPLSGGRGLRWAPGARDGVASHHGGVGVSDADIGELVVLISRAIGSRSNPVQFLAPPACGAAGLPGVPPSLRRRGPAPARTHPQAGD